MKRKRHITNINIGIQTETKGRTQQQQGYKTHVGCQQHR